MKTRLLSKVAVAGLLLTAVQTVGMASPAGAATPRWASPTGSGTACSEAEPCSLDTAVEDASVMDGDEVVVMPGDYTVGDLYINAAITVRAETGEDRPHITTTGGVAVAMSDAVTLRDLDFEHQGNSLGLWVTVGGVVVERVTSRTSQPVGTACSPGHSSTWRDTVCWATGDNSRGMGTNASVFPGPYELTLRNLTLGGSSAALSIGFSGADVDVTVDAKNVIASSSNIDVRASAGDGASVDISLAGSNYDSELAIGSNGGTADITDPGTGTNQTGAPVFVNAASGDFRQAPGSPTIDAGVADPANGTTDFEGDPRVVRATAGCPERIDIGADELVTALECDLPETSITSGPSGKTTDTTPSFGLSSDEAGSFECRVDGGEFAPCTSPYTPAALALGAHTVEARAIDGSENVDATPATRSFTVVLPDTVFTKTPKKKVKTKKKKKAKVTFAFTSTVGGSFQCSLDGAEFKPCSSPRTFKAKLGRHEMRVRSVSAEGVVDRTPAAYVFKVKRKPAR